MYTISYARAHELGYAVKLRFHPADNLREGTICRLQVVPFEALDEASQELLDQYVSDCEGFGTYNQTQGKGNSNYYSLEVTGQINLGELTEQMINGRMSQWYEGFEHGRLSLARAGNAPLGVSFNPDLDAVPAVGRRRFVQA